MTTKHTPGPWTMHPRFADGAEVRALAPVAWCGAASTHGASSSQGIDAAEARANARLIAAAPDLLEACEAFVVAMDSAHDHIERSIALMEKAIAKAKGETT